MEGVNGLCIDSDILIDYLRGVEKSRAYFISSARDSRPLFISVVSIVEVYAGRAMENPRVQRETGLFLANFLTIDLDEALARSAGELRCEYGMPFADAIVAASAVGLNFALATRNVKHFMKIPKLRVVSPY